MEYHTTHQQPRPNPAPRPIMGPAAHSPAALPLRCSARQSGLFQVQLDESPPLLLPPLLLLACAITRRPDLLLVVVVVLTGQVLRSCRC